MTKSNLERLQTIVKGLGELKDKVVFVGGAVVQFYTNDSALADSRSTEDIDCIVRYTSHHDRYVFEEQLRQHQFYEDIDDGVICRWTHQGEKVDIMPTDNRYLSFTNKWYDYGYNQRVVHVLPDDNIIYLMPVTVFVAAKFEALHSRGGNDLRYAHDFEDIIYILNGCNDFLTKCANEENEELKSYLIEQSNWLISRSNIREEIECALPVGEESRSPDLLDLLQQLSDLNSQHTNKD